MTIPSAYYHVGTALDYFRGWNVSWSSPWNFFDSLGSINRSLLYPCNQTRFMLSKPNEDYLSYTGDADGLQRTPTGELVAICPDGYFWLPPSCRDDASKCVPYITGGLGWQLDEVMQKDMSDARRVKSASMSRADGWTIKDWLDCAGVCAMLKQRNLSCSSELAEHGDAWTFILNGVQAANDCLRALHHSLWAAFCLDTQINAYLSAPAAQGLNIHSDPHDVFVLQVEGKKLWHILEGEALSTQSFTLTPGDILYMPAGLLHFAESLDMSSLHITIGVRRESWTASALLAAWIEVDPCISPANGKLTNDTMHKMKLLHQRVSKHFFPWDACNQMLATSLTVPLLRALDEADLPQGLAQGMTMTLAHFACELALKLSESGEEEDMDIAAKLDAMSSKPDPQALLRVVFAVREFRWKQHYEFNNAKKLQFQGTLPELRGSSRLQRCADASAQLSATGLLINGYHILDISEPALPIFRYCMGMHTGAAGEVFRVCEIPGLRELATAFHMPLALAVAQSGQAYANLPLQATSTFYWWVPDPTFLELQPIEALHGAGSVEAWARGDKRTGISDSPISKLVSQDLSTLAPRVEDLVRNVRFHMSDVNRMMKDQKDTGDSFAEVACRWLQMNPTSWETWLPDVTKCFPGLGLYNTNLHKFVDAREDPTHIECRACISGRYSSRLDDSKGLTYVCAECEPGTSQAVGAALSCEPCQLGEYQHPGLKSAGFGFPSRGYLHEGILLAGWWPLQHPKSRPCSNPYKGSDGALGSIYFASGVRGYWNCSYSEP
ncbi:Riox1 [Symbiodinium sp. KB8]|nr:Riox1 [Symbiodinium sp. KB8]